MSADPRLAGSLDVLAIEELERRAASLAQETEEERHDDRLALLLFQLADEYYAVHVSDVREIYQEYAITPIPCVPDHILGVVNIRGEIVSVTDLARMMRLEGPPTPDGLPAIVLRKGEAVTAAVVDAIGDIVEVPRGSLEPPVSMIGKSQAEFVSGSVYVDESLVGIVNLERLLEPIGGE